MKPAGADAQDAPVRGAGDGENGRVKRRTWMVSLLRWSAVLFMLSTLGQAVLAGMFVTGDVDLLRWHDHNAQASSIILTVVIVAAILVWRPGRGAAWPVWITLLILILVEAQKMLGSMRLVSWHIVLGVSIFGMSTALVVWAFGYRLPEQRVKEVE